MTKSTHSASHKPVRVFLVEDQEDIREITREFLTASGFLVVGEACDGTTAISEIPKLRPDIAIVDLRLPDRSSTSLITELLNSNERLVVYVMSARGDFDTVRSCLVAGARGFVEKPAEDWQSFLKAVSRREFYFPRFERYLPTTQWQSGESNIDLMLRNAQAEIVGSYLHDLGNTLQSFWQVWQLNDRQREAQALERAQSLVKAMTDFVRNFYRYAAMDSQQLGRSEIATALEAVCSEARQKYNVSISFGIAESVLGLAIPRMLVERLVAPLLENSAHAVVMAPEPKDSETQIRVFVDLLMPDKTLRVTVEDRGVGITIPPEQLIKFARTGRGFSTKGEGHGRGLEYVTKLTEGIGGDVQIKRFEPIGTKVQLQFPWKILG